MTPEKAYDYVVNMDKRVRIVYPSIADTRVNSDPPVSIPNPKYLRWAEENEDKVDAFWYYIWEGRWRDARRISGLPIAVIAELMEDAHNQGGHRGSTKVRAYIGSISLERFLYGMQMAPEEYKKYYKRYVNNKKAPPYYALPSKAKAAFIWLAKWVEEVKNG